MSTLQTNRTLDLHISGNLAPPYEVYPMPKLLETLLDASIVLREDFDDLGVQIQDEIRKYADSEELLRLLVQYELLTVYQAGRIESGAIFGLVMGNYRVLDRLGAGGMGVIFKGEHIVMRSPVAIKVLAGSTDDARIQQRFLTEIRAIAQLQHPHIVSARDAGQISDGDNRTLRYFVMEFVPGQDLEQYVQANGPLASRQACDVICQVASALVESHQHDLVHRDIKPSNIVLNPDGQTKLLDFGLARHHDYRMTEPGTVLGTLDFMAPEQIRDAGAVDGRADLYALGGTLFWCLTGHTPFSAKSNIVQQIAYRQAELPPSLCGARPELPAGLDAVVRKMMALAPEERYANAEAVLESLRPFLREEETQNIISRNARFLASPGDEGVRPRQRILIVDDEPDIRQLCRCVLEESAVECDEAANGLLALEKIREKRYDLILTDVDMPKMTGMELCRKLQENPPCPNLKVVMMSGREDPDEMAKMLLDGANDYFVKPVSIVELSSKVKAALRLKDAEDRADLLNSHLLAVNREFEQTLSGANSDLIYARNGLVQALARLIEFREGETGGRLRRMERYARCLAEQAAKSAAFAGQIDPNFIELLVCCAPLHDIGKVGLPDHILFKPGNLDAAERIVMESHTIIGSDAMQKVMNQHGSALAFLQMAKDIARHHHERFDGKGFPDRLEGNSIPLAARIVAICDVYDGLRRRRLYQPSISHSSSVEVIMKGSPGQFDPNLLALFDRCTNQFERLYGELANE